MEERGNTGLQAETDKAVTERDRQHWIGKAQLVGTAEGSFGWNCGRLEEAKSYWANGKHCLVLHPGVEQRIHSLLRFKLRKAKPRSWQ